MKAYVVAGGLLLLLLVPFTPGRAASISLVNHTNVWRYRKGAPAIQGNWKTVAEASLDATAVMSGNQMHLQFPAHAGDTYTVQFRNAFGGLQAWTTLTNVPAQPGGGPALIIDPATGASPTRFYRVRTPALP